MRLRLLFLTLSLLMLAACQQKHPELASSLPTQLELASFIGTTVSDDFSISNTGDAPLNFSLSASQNWLKLSHHSGTLAPGKRQVISLETHCETEGTQTASLTILSNDSSTPSKTATIHRTCRLGGAGEFKIDLRFGGSDFSSSRKSVFQNAAARWEALLSSDLANVPLTKPYNNCGLAEPAVNETIDDLLIYAVIKPIDGQGKILGQAGPCLIRSTGAKLPVYGIMQFDSADIAALEASGNLEAVILHEMGHVLGIGTYWEAFGHLDYSANPSNTQCSTASSFTLKPSFNGTNAKAEFTALGASGQPPVEDEFGAGTRCGHWDEAFFQSELMTGFLGPDKVNPLSRLTVASLTDIGYDVSLAAADAYALPGCTPNCLMAEGLHPLNDIILEPIGLVQPDGDIILLAPASP